MLGLNRGVPPERFLEKPVIFYLKTSIFTSGLKLLLILTRTLTFSEVKEGNVLVHADRFLMWTLGLALMVIALLVTRLFVDVIAEAEKILDILASSG